MKKFLVLATMAIAGTVGVSAQGYNLVGLSYENMGIYANKDMKIYDDKSSLSLNGFGVEYVHGFGISKLPMFIEVGGKLQATFKYDSEEEGKIKVTDTWSMLRLDIPVSYAYKFNIKDKFAITPYAGLDFRFNVLAQEKGTVKIGDDKDSFTTNFLNKDDFDPAMKVFQMGWHVGVRFQCLKYFLGISYGTDFLPLWKYEDYHMTTGNLGVTLGMSF